MDLALRFLQTAQGHDHLYILGDLFEYWLGDDAGVPLYQEFIEALHRLTIDGCAVTVMLGNRDFLLGDKFAQASGATLLTADELIITLGDNSALLMHGDTLCIDDHDYQQFRQLVRQASWQSEFLGKTVEERTAIARHMRSASKDASAEKKSHIMDTNDTAVNERIQATGCNILIHGHTHRPATHKIGTSSATRFVVGDWHPDHAQFVQWDNTKGFQMKTFR